MRGGSSACVAAAAALVLSLAGCPTDPGAANPRASFDPTRIEFPPHAPADGAVSPQMFTIHNVGRVRLAVDSVAAENPWFVATPTATSPLPLPAEPGAWVTFELNFVGEPDGSRDDWSSSLTATLSPVDSEGFDQVTSISAVVELLIDCDQDGDGFTAEACGGPDCDDFDLTHSPDTPEACNGLDDDCNGLADSEVAGVAGEFDNDGDGVLSCLDCDDDDPTVRPGATERCDGVDTDCNPATFFEGGEDDFDGDGALACDDCDDGDHDNVPGGTEVCDGADNDCDGAPGALEVDDDGDGLTECDGDCADDNPSSFPFATELCDGLDNDCDAELPLDELDADGDGFIACTECDDDDPTINPVAPDPPGDGVDSNCDGVTDLSTPDPSRSVGSQVRADLLARSTLAGFSAVAPSAPGVSSTVR